MQELPLCKLCVCWVCLAGQLELELECAWAAGRFGGKLHQKAFAGQLELVLARMWVMGHMGASLTGVTLTDWDWLEL